MGATESLLYGDGEDDDRGGGQGDHHQRYGLPSPTSPSPSRPPRLPPAERHLPLPPPERRRSNAQQLPGGTGPPTQSGSKKKKQPKQPTDDRRAGPAAGGRRGGGGGSAEEAPEAAECELRGWIVGLPGSGKRTLLRRLQGRDPFAPRGPTAPTAAAAARPGAAADDDEEEEEQQGAAAAVVPYRSAHPVLHARISLKVRTAHRLPRSEPEDRRAGGAGGSGGASAPDEGGGGHDSDDDQQGRGGGDLAADFVALLVRPALGGDDEKERQRAEEHVRETVGGVLQRAAARHGADPTRGDGPAASRPVCLCVLLNFRDLKPNKKKKTKERSSSSSSSESSSSSSWLSRSTVRRWVMETIQDCDDLSLEPSQLVLQLSDASLYNCYGLDVLHYFVYQSYLCRQQWDARRRLERVRALQRRSADLLSSPSHPGSAPYEAFVRSLAVAARDRPQSSSAESPPSRAEKPSVGSERRESATHLARSTSVPGSEPPRHEVAPPSGRRRITPAQVLPGPNGATRGTQAPPAFSVENSRAALEAFLMGSSDSEDDGDDGRPPSEATTGAGRAAPRRRRGSEDDEDDDDDNFFVESVRAAASSRSEPQEAETGAAGLAGGQERDGTSVRSEGTRAGANGSAAAGKSNGGGEFPPSSPSPNGPNLPVASQAKPGGNGGVRVVARASRVDGSGEDGKAPDGIRSEDGADSAPEEASQRSMESASIREVTVARHIAEPEEEKDSASQGATLAEGDETCAPNDGETPPSVHPEKSNGNSDEFIAKDSLPAANGSSAPSEESVSAEPSKAGSADNSEATDDEGDGAFVIRHTFQAAARGPPGRSRETPAKSDEAALPGSRSGAGPATAPASAGLSVAAREAIARAQREAERLAIPRRESDVDGSAKRKDRKEKKKKKDKKRGGRGEGVVAS